MVKRIVRDNPPDMVDCLECGKSVHIAMVRHNDLYVCPFCHKDLNLIETTDWEAHCRSFVRGFANG